MNFPWSKPHQRAALLAEPFPAEWRRHLAAHVALYRRLPPPARQKLEDGTRILVAEKSWEGVNGLTLTDEIKVTVAGLASLLTLGFEHNDYYPNVETIIVYPDGFLVTQTRSDVRGLLAEDVLPLSGQAALSGPIIVSWADVLSGPRLGQSVVLHEFAHKLDMRDGSADGAPRLGDAQIETWSRVMSAEYAHLVAQTQGGEHSVLDAYGATNAAEFFAVATEAFFMRSAALSEMHPELYAVLKDFYRQDPAMLMA